MVQFPEGIVPLSSSVVPTFTVKVVLLQDVITPCPPLPVNNQPLYAEGIQPVSNVTVISPDDALGVATEPTSGPVIA